MKNIIFLILVSSCCHGMKSPEQVRMERHYSVGSKEWLKAKNSLLSQQLQKKKAKAERKKQEQEAWEREKAHTEYIEGQFPYDYESDEEETNKQSQQPGNN